MNKSRLRRYDIRIWRYERRLAKIGGSYMMTIPMWSIAEGIRFTRYDSIGVREAVVRARQRSATVPGRETGTNPGRGV